MIEKQLIFLDDAATTRQEVLEKILTHAVELNLVTDKDKALQAIMEREKTIPTSVGMQVAIPHCRVDSIVRPFISFLRTKETFIWDERNQEPVDFIFLIAIPESVAGNLHLKYLSAISRKLMHEDFRASLRHAPDVDHAYEILEAINQGIGA